MQESQVVQAGAQQDTEEVLRLRISLFKSKDPEFFKAIKHGQLPQYQLLTLAHIGFQVLQSGMSAMNTPKQPVLVGPSVQPGTAATRSKTDSSVVTSAPVDNLEQFLEKQGDMGDIFASPTNH